MTPRLMTAAVTIVVLSGTPMSALLGQDAPAERSTRQGVYTEAQAERGEATYRKYCTECHVPAAVSGPVFRRSWAGRTVFDFYELVRTTMPNDNPGRLTRGQYAEIVAYILRLSGFPPGAQPLPAEAATLKLIRIEVEPATRS